MTNTEEILMRVGMDLASINAKTDELMRRQKTATEHVAGMWKQLGHIISGEVIISSIEKVINKFDDLQDRADNLGVGTDFLQGLSAVSGKNAVGGVETFNKAITELSVRLGDAKDGGEEAIKKFQKYGITITEIKNLNTEEMFYRISDAIAKIQDPAKRSAVSFDLLGRSGKNLTGVLASGSEELKKMSGEITKLDAAHVKQLAEAKDQIEDVKNTALVVGGKILGWIGDAAKGYGRLSVGIGNLQKSMAEEERQNIKSILDEHKKSHLAKLAAIAEEKKARWDAYMLNRRIAHDAAVAQREDLRKQQGELMGKLQGRNAVYSTVEEVAGRDALARIQGVYGEGGAKDLSSGKGRFAAVAQEYLDAKGEQEYARQRGWTKRAEMARERMNRAQGILENAGVLEKKADWVQMGKDLMNINKQLSQLEVTIKGTN